MDTVQPMSNRILVVEDEHGVRTGCQRALTSAGYAVDTAVDLSGALDLIRSGSYDLYLLDVMLPDGSGMELLSLLLKQDPDVICIIITGFASIELAVEATKQGAHNFLAKPFTSDGLLMTVEQGLEWRRLKKVEAEAAELARAKEELERLDQVKSRLMLQVAHELRAPVAAAQSYVNLILSGHIPQEETNSTLTRIQERLQELLDTTADLLELAHLKQLQDQFIAEATPQDMALIVQDVIAQLGEQARAKGLAVQLECPDHLMVQAHRDHLKQIWMNLLSNAIKYSDKGGRVSVRLRAEEDALIGTVEDSGIGIAEADLDHLFQEFFRTDEAKASGQIGTGLGLSIVKQIVDSYGGELRVASQIGQGSHFSFILPLEPRLGDAPAARTESALPFDEDRVSMLPRSSTHTRQISLGED